MGFAHLTLAVRNVQRSVAFFQSTLLWKPLDRPQNIAYPAGWLEIDPGQELHLIEIPTFQPSAFEQEYGRHVAISFPRAAFAALQDRLRQHGAEVIPPERETPFQRFFFRDPNGYMFEVVEEERMQEVLGPSINNDECLMPNA